MNTRIAPKTVVLLGIPFHDVTMEETLAEIDRMIAERKPRYIATANLDFTALASWDVELQRILMDADLVLCDGTPLVWASRILKAPLRERVAGADLTPRLMAHAAERGYRAFFLGSDETVLATAKGVLEERNPGLTVCGVYAPPYARLLELDHDEIAGRIRDARPDILLVALGSPKQEKWIYMNHRELGVPCSIGIGASLDFVAGKFARAPVWMQKAGMEWLFRLKQEPSRLFARYYRDFVFFAAALYKQKRGLREPAATPAPKASEADGVDFFRQQWTGRADASVVLSGAFAIEAPKENAFVLLDLSGVTFMDSTGLGAIMTAFRQCKQRAGGLILLRPSQPVRALLQTLKLDRLIPIVETLEEARTASRSLRAGEEPRCEVSADQRRLTIRCTGDLTAAPSRALFETILREWAAAPLVRTLELDLSDVHFIDSSGLDCLVRARSLAQSRRNGWLRLAGANGNVRNVLALAPLNEPFKLDIIAA